MSQSSKTLLWIIIIVVILLALVLFIIEKDSDGLPDRVGEEIEEISPGQTKRVAEKGTFIENFPDRLILDEQAVAGDSYSISYADEGLEQPVVEYMTSASPDDLIDLYKLYFITNGWVTRQEDNFSQEDIFTAFVYAVRATEEANVTIISDNNETRVVISYLNRDNTSAQAGGEGR